MDLFPIYLFPFKKLLTFYKFFLLFLCPLLEKMILKQAEGGRFWSSLVKIEYAKSTRVHEELKNKVNWDRFSQI